MTSSTVQRPSYRLHAALLAVQRGYETHVFDQATRRPKPQLVADLGATYHSGALTDVHLAPEAAAPADDRDGDTELLRAQRLLRRTVAARRKLADIVEALARLASGSFGRL